MTESKKALAIAARLRDLQEYEMSEHPERDWALLRDSSYVIRSLVAERDELARVFKECHSEHFRLIKEKQEAEKAFEEVRRYERDNHHNARMCPYCTPNPAERELALDDDEWDQIRRELDQ